jgi:Ca-activated chloride channel family protein
MNFVQPYWLLAGLTVCLFLAWRYRRYNRQQRVALVQFVSARLLDKLTASVSASRRRLKQGLFIAGVACLFVALARPQVGFHWQEVHRKGIELLVAVDTSKSMLTQDVKPDRLGRAKLAVNDLVDKLDGDGIGLLAFAGDAFLQCPITLDYDAFRESVDSLDTGVISRGGTDIGGAIREAQAVLDARPDKEKVLVLITDGEDLGGDAVAAAQAAAKDGMKIFTVGVGSAAGELIPVPNANGGTDFVKDDSGQFVKSRLDEAALKQIAAVTGGMYEPLGQQGQGLTAIYDQGLSQFTRHDLASRQTKVYLEQFQWPLLAGLLCFVSELLIGTRKSFIRKNVPARSEKPVILATGTPARWSPAHAAASVALALFLLPATSHASPTTAEKAYQKGDYTVSEKEYAATVAKQPKQPKLDFNLGSAAYKSGDYAEADKAFQNTLNTTEVPVQQNAYYNLGNTQYRVGQQTEKANPQDTIKTWEEAVKSYDAALQIKTNDADAKFNRDLVQKKLEQLQKQQQQKQDQQNKDQQKNQQNQPNQNQQNSDQSQNQAQSKPDQKNQGQGQQAQNQSGQNDQQQNQQNQPKQQANNGSQGNEKKPAQPDQQSAQNGQPQSPKPDGQKTDNANGGQPQNQPAQAAEDAQSQPGQMTKEEAKQLLDSLKGDEHKLPAAQFARGPVKPQDNQPLKDW